MPWRSPCRFRAERSSTRPPRQGQEMSLPPSHSSHLKDTYCERRNNRRAKGTAHESGNRKISRSRTCGLSATADRVTMTYENYSLHVSVLLARGFFFVPLPSLQFPVV